MSEGEKGMPTVFIQTARADWINDLLATNPDKGMIRGHILVAGYVQGQWYLADCQAIPVYSI